MWCSCLTFSCTTYVYVVVLHDFKELFCGLSVRSILSSDVEVRDGLVWSRDGDPLIPP